MKYVVEFELEKEELKADYRRTFISFFKKAISEYMDGFFYDDLYQSGAKKKNLVWSVKFEKPQFKDGVMILEGKKVFMTLKIGDAQTALIYYSSLLGMKDRMYPVGNDNFLTLRRIKMLRENEIVEDIAVFKIFSPINLREHNEETNKDWYYSFGDEKFEEKLKESILIDLPYLKQEVSALSFDFSGLKKVIVPAFELKIPATIGTFAVKGDKRVINHILMNGIGSRRNSGFGLVENILL